PGDDRARIEGDGHDGPVALHGQSASHPRLRARTRQPREGGGGREDRDCHIDPRRRRTVIENFIGDATQRMDKSVEATHEHFNSVRTGRATPALLDRITIDYYGTPTPLKNLATISAPEPRLLSIQPFDPSSLKQIETTIHD